LINELHSTNLHRFIFRLVACPAAYATDPITRFSLNYLGQQILPSGATFDGTATGGFSSLDYNKSTDRYLAISDDRSYVNHARFYELRLDLDRFQRSATPGHAGVSFNTAITLQTPGGGAFSENQMDPEALRLDPVRNKIYWSSEGQRSSAGYQNPTVREMNVDGSYARDFAVPHRYLPSGSVGGLDKRDTGVYNNLGFESLAISDDGNTLHTATENGLAQDSPPASVSDSSRSRILSFDITTGQSKAEYIYDVSPVAIGPSPANQFATNGLTDFIVVGDRQFITIERSFAVGAQTPGTPITGNTIQLYYADARNATDVSGLESVAGENVTAVTKTLLLDLSSLKNDDGSPLALDNIEGITFGPKVNDEQTLILVSDNNFNNAQFTQFVALQVSQVPSAGTKGMLLARLALVCVIIRRRTPMHS
jgi:hypothetical protein